MFEKILLAVDGSEHALHCRPHCRRPGARHELQKNFALWWLMISYRPISANQTCNTPLMRAWKKQKPFMQKAIKAVGNIPCEIHTELIEGLTRRSDY